VLTKVKEKEKYYPSIPYPIRIYKKKKKKKTQLSLIPKRTPYPTIFPQYPLEANFFPKC
jgi:hypothetical protein